MEPHQGIEPCSPSYKDGASPQCLSGFRGGDLTTRLLRAMRLTAFDVHRPDTATVAAASCLAFRTALQPERHSTMRQFMKPLFCIALLSLSACSHTGGVRVKTVRVPVPAPCQAEIPPEPEHVAPQLNGQAAHDLAIVAASALSLRIWGRSLKASLEACAE